VAVLVDDVLDSLARIIEELLALLGGPVLLITPVRGGFWQLLGCFFGQRRVSVETAVTNAPGETALM
jgi:hypothetical protein